MDPHTAQVATTVVTILRHGQGFHNVNRNYALPDPPLTSLGRQQALAAQPHLPAPDLIIVSPMTRAIQTALLAFSLEDKPALASEKIQVWPDLRETHDSATCNQGVSKDKLAATFPQLDLSECHDEWDYEGYSEERAQARAETVRLRLKHLAQSGLYKNIVLVTHRGFIAHLVPGERFQVCEHRPFRFASEEEIKGCRYGLNCDANKIQDYGPSLLIETERAERQEAHL